MRLLNPLLLQHLNDENGPKEGECSARWERWWDACQSQGEVGRLFGWVLGNLPQDPVGEEYDEGDEEDEEYYTEDEEEEPTGRRVSNLAELRELLEECRRMSAEGEHEPPFLLPY